MNITTLRAFESELEKLSARAGVKLIRSLFSKGTPEALQHASTLAKTPGVLKPNALGSQVKHLGAGAEGVADLVAHPDYGLSVRKLYDPTSGIASPTMIGRKMQLAKSFQHPEMAGTYGFGRTGRGGRLSFHEYSPGAEPTRLEESGIKRRLQISGAEKGYHLEDIRGANIRGGKAIDVLPFREGEVAGMTGPRGNVLMLTPRGLSKFSPHMRKALLRSEKGLSKEQLYGLLHGGASVKPLQSLPSSPARGVVNLPPPPALDLKSMNLPRLESLMESLGKGTATVPV